MKEILWLLVVAVSLVAIVSAPARMTKLRWLLLIALLILVGGLYVSRNGVLRVGLNLLLFFDRHTILFVVLLILSLVGVVFAWRARLKPLGWVCGLILVFLASGLSLSSVLYGVPEDFADIEDQFKYGSIGSDHFMARGIPYWVWKVLPEVFPPSKTLRDAYKSDDYDPPNDKKSYEAFGLLQEEHKEVSLIGHDTEKKVIDRPIGFSKRKVFGMDFIGLNCAFCHVSTIRKGAESPPQIVLGMPANTVDIELFFLFLFAAAEDKDFYDKVTTGVTKAIWNLEPDQGIGSMKRFAYRVGYRFLLIPAYRFALIPLTQYYAQRLKKDFYFIDPQNPHPLTRRVPRFGPGRVDAWSPAKTTLVNPKQAVEYPGGIIDYMSIWNQKAREGMRLHWDGNTDVLFERNIVAGLVVNGPAIECLDIKRLTKITDWIKARPAPRFDDFRPKAEAEGYPPNMDTVENGRRIFQHWCASCHAPGGDRVGRVEPLDTGHLDTDYRNTDPARITVFTGELADALNTIGTDTWQLRNFRVQKGYVNMLLDGVWLRAPYLHNGSVPTLRDLLNKPDERPAEFCRGIDVYDWEKVGFVSTTAQPNCVGSRGERFFPYDTRVAGNRNTGHLYGTDLPDADKDALLQFLKTL